MLCLIGLSKGFQALIALVNDQVNCIQDYIKDTNLNSTVAAEDAPEIEHNIRSVNEHH